MFSKRGFMFAAEWSVQSDVNQSRSRHNLENSNEKVAKVAVDREGKIPIEMLKMRCAE